MKTSLCCCLAVVTMVAGCGTEAGIALDPTAARVEAAVVAPTCSASKLADVLAPATSAASSVTINCSLTLSASNVVTKRLVFNGTAASNTLLKCNGALLNGADGQINAGRDMIEVKSKKVTDSVTGEVRWERPENVTIDGCRIVGSVRIWGMAKNGEGADLRASSVSAGHTDRARNAAPKNIVLRNVNIRGTGRIPLYLAPGVTYSQLLDSEIEGDTSSVAVYLDAESYRNTLKGNYIHASTEERELMAIDGSSYNQILNNRFSALNHGGIYLYRNCGEGGTVRHATPRSNTIVNNVFYYNKYNGSDPAIYLSSRDGWRSYCYEDSGYSFGSSSSNLDYARYNVVMQNQIYKRSVSDMIRVGSSAGSYNYVGHNTTVTTEVSRLAGCHVLDGYFTDFILDGETIDTFADARGDPTCTGFAYACNDGVRSTVTTSACNIATRGFSCRVDGNNNGCSTNATCPSGTSIIGAVAACNLEYGAVSSADVDATHVNRIRVVRASDTVSDGSCWVGSKTVRSGEGTITGITGRTSVTAGCREHDKNGGDCHVVGTLYCQ